MKIEQKLPVLTEVTNERGGSFWVDMAMVTWFGKQIDSETKERKEVGILIGIYGSNRHLECDNTTIEDFQRARASAAEA